MGTVRKTHLSPVVCFGCWRTQEEMKIVKFLFLFFVNDLVFSLTTHRKKACRTWTRQKETPTQHRGYIEFTVPSKVTHWQITISFNKSCKTLQVSNAISRPKYPNRKNNKVWILSHLEWNRELLKGSIFRVWDLVCDHNTQDKDKHPRHRRKIIG